MTNNSTISAKQRNNDETPLRQNLLNLPKLNPNNLLGQRENEGFNQTF